VGARARARVGLAVRATGDYVPSPLDTTVIVRQLEVLGAVGVMGAYWWYVLVPNARVNLAVNKRKGDLRQYLEELKQDDSRPVERWFYRCGASFIRYTRHTTFSRTADWSGSQLKPDP